MKTKCTRCLLRKKEDEFYRCNNKYCKSCFISNLNDYTKNRDCGLYRKYTSMVRRCRYKSQKGYEYYGGKGISVRWRSYKEFKNDMYVSYLEHVLKFGKKRQQLTGLITIWTTITKTVSGQLC